MHMGKANYLKKEKSCLPIQNIKKWLTLMILQEKK